MKTNFFNRIMLLLFLLFLGVYFAGKTGYYESVLHNKKELTEEQIIKFENDIASNIEVDLNEYIPKEEDNSNFVSRGGYNISQVLSNLLNDKCKDIWLIIKTLFIT